MLFRFATVTLALAVAALICEFALRVGGFGRTYTNPACAFFEPDEEMGCRGKPNVTARFRRLDFDVIVEHDQNGFRRGLPTADAAAEHDVYVLGDSFVWGYGVGQDDIVTNQMARLLKTQRVHNFGLAGAGTVEEFLILQKYVLNRLAPGDAVVLVFDGNDYADNLGLGLNDRTHAVVENGQIRRVPPPKPDEFVLWQHQMRESSNLINLVAYSVDTIQYRLSLKRLQRRGDASAEELRIYLGDDAIQITRHYLAEIKNACASKQARFLTAMIPGPAELREDDIAPLSELSLPGEIACRQAYDRLVRDLGIESVDLMAPMLEAKRSGRFDRMLFAHDIHWCAAGNTVAAEAIAAAITPR